MDEVKILNKSPAYELYLVLDTEAGGEMEILIAGFDDEDAVWRKFGSRVPPSPYRLYCWDEFSGNFFCKYDGKLNEGK